MRSSPRMLLKREVVFSAAEDMTASTLCALRICSTKPAGYKGFGLEWVRV